MEASAIRPAAVLAVLMLAPLAQGAEVALETSEPVAIEAAAFAGTAASSLYSYREAGTGNGTLRLAAGQLRFYTWERPDVAVVGSPRIRPDVERTVVDVENATLDLAFREETLFVLVQSTGGAITARSPRVADLGRPALLAEPYDHHPGADDPDGVEHVEVAWEAGWAFLGDMARVSGPLVGFPELREPRLDLRGEHLVQVYGGTVSFTDRDGKRHDVKLGVVDRSGPGLPARADVTTVRRLVVEGAFEAADVPLDDWGMAAPAMTWTLDGDLRWRGATGRAVVDGKATAFEREDVELALAGRVGPEIRSLQVAADAYAAEGEFRALRVGSADLVRAAPERVPLVAPLTAAALLALALTKLGQSLVAAAAASLYTRIVPSRALDHPERRRLMDLVLAEPGIHQRELHRRFGTVWGKFSFHLQMLERAGLVRVAKVEGYALVFTPDTVARASSAIPQPVARAVYDALPPDGRPVDVADLVAAAGVSRDLVRYHLRGLERRGLVRSIDGTTLVGRTRG